MTDWIDKSRLKLEETMYDLAVRLAEKRGLSYQEIRENFQISIEAVIDSMEYQHPEIGENGHIE